MNTTTRMDPEESTVGGASEPAPSSIARPRQPGSPWVPAGTAILELTITMPEGTVTTVRGQTYGGVLTIGREFGDPRPHLVAVPHPHVSQKHARLLVGEGGALYVADAGSTNGTCVAGAPVGAAWRELGPDGRFTIANLTIATQLVGFENDRPHAPTPPSTSSQRTESCVIELRAAVIDLAITTPEGEEWVGRARAYAGFVYIGREPQGVGDDWIAIPHTQVSRQHASLEVDDEGRISIRDIGSRNGTYVGGDRIQGRVPLGPNGEFLLSEVRVRARFLGFEDVFPAGASETSPPPPKDEIAGQPSPQQRPASWANWVRRKLSGE
jgi:pSer/pThr/pTyr-binding forkhead associated (FHA) protein